MDKNSFNLEEIARKHMLSRGLQPDYPKASLIQLEQINAPAALKPDMEDLRTLLFCSIDNDDSRDLDQLTYAEAKEEGNIAIYIAIADVDALVDKGTPIDQHAQVNTTSVYTPAKIFPMLPEKLSTNLTSLNEGEDRAAVVVKAIINPEGEVVESKILHAYVHNYAQLTYNGVGAWLQGNGEIPAKAAAVAGLAENLQLQNQAAMRLRARRYSIGALSLETPEAVPIYSGGRIVSMEPAEINQAHRLIEHFMIAANTCIARFLAKEKIPSLRRVVRIPKRWDKIVELAQEKGYSLPLSPDSKALDQFLIAMREKDPVSFPDLSLSIVKLLGSGEYIVEKPGEAPIGHFGLALRNYTHSTAPNRRYPDVITQRQLKKPLGIATINYSNNELEKLAYHCTIQEDAADKVQRATRKSAAALLLQDRTGETFEGIITGASDKGTWVRIFHPAVEGKIVKGAGGLDVNDRVVVKLIGTNVPEGFIDFERVSAASMREKG